MSNSEGSTKICFVISSVIFFADSPLSYSDSRSVFTSSEREEQTIQTIKSIKNRLPNAKICLIESGRDEAISSKIVDAIDIYIYVGNNKIVRKACDGSKKGLGEVIALLFGLRKARISKSEFDYFFKISGRYCLTDDFKASKFLNNCDFTFKKYNDPVQVSTRLYGFYANKYWNWNRAMLRTIPSLLINKSIEQQMYIKTRSYNCNYIKNLGVKGLVGPDGGIIIE